MTGREEGRAASRVEIHPSRPDSLTRHRHGGKEAATAVQRQLAAAAAEAITVGAGW
jgi:hypothetical protein